MDVRKWRPHRKLVTLGRRYLPGPAVSLVSWARSDESLLTAASLAFFSLVSIPPTALICFRIAGAVVGEERLGELGEKLAAAAPAEVGADGMLIEAVEVATQLGWGAVFAALWPATAYGAALARAFDRLTPTGRRPLDGIRGRLLLVVVIPLLPLFVLGVLVVVVVLPRIVGNDAMLRVVGWGLSAVVGVGVLTGLFAVLYDLFSPADVGYRAASRGAAWAAALITLISAGYAVYLRVGANFEEQYGSSTFAAVILLGLWLYLANGALIVGYKSALVRADAPAWDDDSVPSEAAPRGSRAAARP